jgi:hypothetical protein
MKILNPKSLALTLDAVNEAFFYGDPINKTDRTEIAQWIASRQGLPKSYAGMFAPTERDYNGDIKVFTGEAIKSNVGVSHILGEEACRALLMLDVKDAKVRDSLKRASEGLLERLNTPGRTCGHYCCGKCSVSMWRQLVVGGLKDQDRELAEGLNILKRYRDGKGKWRTFPFHYTVLSLYEINTPQAKQELEYVSSTIERIAKRPASDKFACRRKELAERILANGFE